MTSKGTAKPGVRVPQELEKKLISDFYAKYRKVADDQAPNIPTWSTFTTSVKVGEDILSNEALQIYRTLFVFFEYLDEVYSANIEEIRHFFANREPWEDYDVYIFPEDMHWCIAFTHEQMYGIYVFVTGDLNEFFSS